MVKKCCCIAWAILAIPVVAWSQNRPDLIALRERIEPQIAQIRSLRFIRPFEVRYQTNAEISAFIDASANMLPQNYRQNFDLIIRAIGLHHGGVPISIETITGATQTAVAAYYDPETRSVNIPIRTYPPGDLELIMAHELVHALQDMHFGLGRLLSDATHSDQLIARQALVEGEATLVETLWLFAATGRTVPDTELQNIIDRVANISVDEFKRRAKDEESDPQIVKEIDETPDFFYFSLLAPYYRGLAFVFALKRYGGWNAVSRAYTRLPASSEHILHPDKYIAGESPEEIALPDLAREHFAGDWELLDMDTLGELGFRIIFNAFDLNVETAHAAAAGWHGDQYAVFKHRQQNTPALVLFTTWDTEQDATEFTTAYKNVLAIKRRGTTDFRIDQLGRDVLIAESPRDLDGLFAYVKKVRSTPTLALADFDFDGDLTIDFDDFLAFAAHFGLSSSDPDFDPRFDFDDDGMVGFSDFLKFAAAFGKTIAPTPNTKPAVVIDPRFIHRALGFVR